MGSLEEAIKGAQKLSEAASKTQISPHAADYHYYKSFPEFKSRVNEVQKSIQDTLLACQAAAAPKSSKGTPVVDWEDANEVREWVGCALDDCMEGVDAAIDQHRKAVKQQALAEENAPNGVGVNAGAAPQVLPSQLGPVSSIGGAPKGLLRNLQAGRSRPQEMFDLPVDNSPQPFQHWAPHLASVLPSTAVPAPGTEQASANPFAPVLGQLTYKPSHLDASTVCPPRPLEETPIAWVDTPEALNAVASELQGEQHIAVDLEHHSYRSFQGFTCLMQLSSRTKDYIVDTLALRKHIGPALIGIFANPAIVKVLHGADHDVLWLQRDFHLYLVNMFDTGQATRVLSYPSNSLAFLLEQFCGVKADKRFQLADWRARPLSPEMLDYARGDTHYLLYCYDRLKQELVNMGDQVPPSLLAQGGPQAPTPCVGGLALATVLERSRQLCLASYEKELPPTKQSCDDSVLRWELSLTSLQREVLFAAALWRDTVCRELDEGTGYVLPRSQLITLAQHMPDTAKDVLRLLGRSASEALRSRAPALAARIHAAKAESAAATAAKEAAAAAALTAASISPSAVSAPAADPGTAPAAAPAHPPVTTDAHAAGLLGTSVGMPPALAQGVSLAEPAGAYAGSMDAQQVAALSHATPGMAMTASTAPTSATAAAPAHSVSGPSTSNPAATTAPGVVLAPKPVAPIKSKASRGGGLFGGAGNAAKKQKVGPHASVAPVSKPGEVGTAPAANAAHATQVLTEAGPLAAGTAAAADAATAAQGGQTLLQAAEGGQAPSQASRAAGGGQACSHAPSPAADRGQVSSQASRAAEGGQAPQQAAEGGQAPSQASQAAGGGQACSQVLSQAAEGGQSSPQAPSRATAKGQGAEGGQAPSQASQAAGGGQACSQAPSQAAEGGQSSPQAPSRATAKGQGAEGGQAPSQASQAAGGGQACSQAPSQAAEGGQSSPQAPYRATAKGQGAEGGQAPLQAAELRPPEAPQALGGGVRSESTSTPASQAGATEQQAAPASSQVARADTAGTTAGVGAGPGASVGADAGGASNPSSLTTGPPSVSKPVGKAKKARGSLAGLLGPTMHPSPATHEAAGTGPQNSGAAGGGPDGVGEGKLVAQLKASLALPFPVLAPPVGGEASQGNGEGHLEVSTGADNAQQQQQQHEQQLKQHVQGEQEQGIQQQQEQQHEQHIQGEQEQGIQEGFHGGGGQHHPGGHGEVSLPFVPIPKNKDRKPGKPEGRHQQGGISQMSLPRVSKDTLKRKYISVQEGGGGKDDLDG